jgi:peroxiredoxin
MSPGDQAPDFGLPDQDAQPVVHLPDYEQAGAVVLGASPDSVSVWAEKSMYGKTYWGAQRATFIIDHRGKWPT